MIDVATIVEMTTETTATATAAETTAEMYVDLSNTPQVTDRDRPISRETTANFFHVGTARAIDATTTDSLATSVHVSENVQEKDHQSGTDGTAAETVRTTRETVVMIQESVSVPVATTP